MMMTTRRRNTFMKGLAAISCSLMLVLAGCGDAQGREPDPVQEHVIGNPVPADFLNDGDADIFYYGEIVYTNAANIDWVQDYVLEERAGEITKQSNDAEDFEEWTANKLPVGTEIYNTDKGAVYVAVVDGEEIPYLGMIEG